MPHLEGYDFMAALDRDRVHKLEFTPVTVCRMVARPNVVISLRTNLEISCLRLETERHDMQTVSEVLEMLRAIEQSDKDLETPLHGRFFTGSKYLLLEFLERQTEPVSDNHSARMSSISVGAAFAFAIGQHFKHGGYAGFGVFDPASDAYHLLGPTLGYATRQAVEQHLLKFTSEFRTTDR